MNIYIISHFFLAVIDAAPFHRLYSIVRYDMYLDIDRFLTLVLDYSRSVICNKIVVHYTYVRMSSGSTEYPCFSAIKELNVEPLPM